MPPFPQGNKNLKKDIPLPEGNSNLMIAHGSPVFNVLCQDAVCTVCRLLLPAFGLPHLCNIATYHSLTLDSRPLVHVLKDQRTKALVSFLKPRRNINRRQGHTYTARANNLSHNPTNRKCTLLMRSIIHSSSEKATSQQLECTKRPSSNHEATYLPPHMTPHELLRLQP
jgi:hypothetical protein